MEISFIEELSKLPEKSKVSITLIGDIFDDQKIKNATSKVQKLYIKEGKDSFQKLNGHFVIIIKDGVNQKSFVINDRFNSIPLFFQYSPSSRKLFCSNQIRKLYKKTGHLEFNVSSILTSNHQDYGNYLESFYHDVFVLKGGRYIEFDHKKNNYSIKSYWDILDAYLHAPQTAIDENIDYYISNYREILKKAANKRNNEKTIGLFLSGGYDSTSILSLLKNKKIDTYSMHFTFSTLHHETDKMLATIKANEVKNTQCVFKSNYHITDEYWYNLVAITESPAIKIGRCFNSFILHHLKEQNINTERNSILSGLGSDELNGGRLDLNGDITQSREIFGKYIEYYKHTNSLFKDVDFSINNYLKSKLNYKDEDAWGSIINKLQNRNYLNDRWEESHLALHNGFYYSCPFMDNELVEFVLSIPKKFHHYLFFNKQILIEAMENDLPKEFKNYSKYYPMNSKEKKLFEQLIISPLCRDRNFKLLKRVYEESEFVNEMLDIDSVISNFSKTDKIPVGFNEVLKIVNCGIIESSFKNETNPVITNNIINLNNVKITDSKNYNKEEVAKFLELEKYEFSMTGHYAISNEVELTINPIGNDLYIIKNNELKYVIDDPDLKNIIFKLDETKSIGYILKENTISSEKAFPMLKELFDNDILDFITEVN